MNHYGFELFLHSPEDPAALHADEFLDMVEDVLFEAFRGDVTPGMCGGMPVLYCSLEAASLDDALGSVAQTVVRLGLHPMQLQMRLNEAGHRYA